MTMFAGEAAEGLEGGGGLGKMLPGMGGGGSGGGGGISIPGEHSEDALTNDSDNFVHQQLHTGATLDVTPMHEWARMLVATGLSPAEVMRQLRGIGVSHQGARSAIEYAVAGPMSNVARLDGDRLVAIAAVDGDTVIDVQGNVYEASRISYAAKSADDDFDEDHPDETDDKGEQVATAPSDGGAAEPGTDIPRIEERDQTDAKKDKRHILHHTNDAREHAAEYGYGLPWGGTYGWCDQCNGSGCGHCGGTGQVEIGKAPTAATGGGVGDNSTTSSPVADQNVDAGDMIASDGMKATGALSAPCETPGAQYSTSVSGDTAEISVRLPFELPISSAADAAHLEAHMHNAMEDILAPYFDHKTADYTADSFLTGPPAQNYQAPTPHSNSDNPGSTGFATSADAPDWEQPIIGRDEGITWDAARHPGLPQPPMPREVTWSQLPSARTALREGDPSLEGTEPPTVSGVCVKAADTGRVLMIQRSHQDEKDPARGTWEFPGGHHEDGDLTSLHAGIREWQEEVGQPFPEGGHVAHTWRSGPYQGHVVIIPEEKGIDFSKGRSASNPDDPDGDDHEQAAWWEIEHAKKNPALRGELKQAAPWSGIGKAASLYDERYNEHSEDEEERPCQDDWCRHNEPFHTENEHIDPSHRDVGHEDYQSAEHGVEDAIGNHPDAWLLHHQPTGPTKYSTLHDEPEPALPSTDGASDTAEPAEDAQSDTTIIWPDVNKGIETDRKTAWGYPEQSPEEPKEDPDFDPGSADHDMLTDDSISNSPFRVDAAADPILQQFWQTAGAQALKGGGKSEPVTARQASMAGAQGQRTGKDFSDGDIAAAARAALAKTSAKDFNFAEQQELINEGLGSKARARNFSSLSIKGTHYEHLDDEEDDGYPF